MGCGCNKKKTSSTRAAAIAAPTSTLFEVVNAAGEVKFRSRDERVAQQKVAAGDGVRYRKAGQP